MVVGSVVNTDQTGCDDRPSLGLTHLFSVLLVLKNIAQVM